MRLTERDFDLLRFLGAQGVATAYQLTERYFPTRKTCLNRLYQLRQGGLVESVPLSALKEISINSFKQAAQLLALRREEAWRYRLYRLSSELRSRSTGGEAMADIKMWKHQIQLNGIRRLFERLFPGAMILIDPEIRAEWRRFKSGADMPIPDLVIRRDGQEFAVELERTRKSEKDYFTRFFQLDSSVYSHVLYFCESDELFKKIADLSKDFAKIGVSRLMSPELIYRKRDGFQSLYQFLGIDERKGA
jgi:hypothetical protein